MKRKAKKKKVSRLNLQSSVSSQTSFNIRINRYTHLNGIFLFNVDNLRKHLCCASFKNINTVVTVTVLLGHSGLTKPVGGYRFTYWKQHSLAMVLPKVKQQRCRFLNLEPLITSLTRENFHKSMFCVLSGVQMATANQCIGGRSQIVQKKMDVVFRL